MRVKITGASGLVWYKDQIGNTFTCHDRSESYYGLGAKGMTGLTIQKWDCEILPDENLAQPEPFDLERALNGEKVVMRDGTEVEEVIAFKAAEQLMPVMAACKDGINMYTLDGKYYKNADDKKDLFMAPKEPPVTVTRWVNIYKGHVYPFVAKEKLFMTQNEAYSARDKEDSKYICSSPVTLYLNKQL